MAHELIAIGVNDTRSFITSPGITIGVEKGDIISLKDSGHKVILLGKKMGESIFRIGEKTYKIIVLSQSHLKTYQKLSKLLSLNNHLVLDYSENYFRVSGKLDHPSTWISMSQLFLNNFLMEVTVGSQHLRMIEYKINKELATAGLFPIRISQEPNPTVRLPPNTLETDQIREILSHYGIVLKKDERRIYTEPLIRVQVTLAEIRKSFSQNIGLEWPNQFNAKIVSDGLIGIDQANLMANFLSKKGEGRILANPVLVTKSGSEAEFFAGGEFPIRTKTKQTQTVTWKKYGITLKIKPRSDPEGKLSLDLSCEFSTIDSGEKTDGIPALFNNTISSHFDLESSQTLALSGLIKKIDGESIKQWPGLGEIPILGGLFSSRDFQEDKTELVVFVTPSIYTQDQKK